MGAHGDAECSACHAQLRKPDELGRTFAPASGPGCADCHQDPHAGQFDVDGWTECSRCHTSFVRSYLSFDHERDARFALGEAHAEVACSACHPTTIRQGIEVVHYQPLGIECVDCHGVHEEVLLRRKTRKK